MHPATVFRRARLPLIVLLLLLPVAACGAAAPSDPDAPTTPGAAADAPDPLVVSAIPDQDPQELQRLYGMVTDHLADELELAVEYVPVTDYQASVSLFRAGDLDLVWFGGLTGVQARLQTDGAEVIAQRDIDEAFHSVFIASSAAGVEPFEAVDGLTALEGLRFTFGSESSTSGRLMPTYFLEQAGIRPEDFTGEPGYSGSHDKTIDLVEAGTFEAGVLNEQVWDARVEAGTVDESSGRRRVPHARVPRLPLGAGTGRGRDVRRRPPGARARRAVRPVGRRPRRGAHPEPVRRPGVHPGAGIRLRRDRTGRP